MPMFIVTFHIRRVDAGAVLLGQQRAAIQVVDGSDVEGPPGSRANARCAPRRDRRRSIDAQTAELMASTR